MFNIPLNEECEWWRWSMVAILGKKKWWAVAVKKEKSRVRKRKIGNVVLLWVFLTERGRLYTCSVNFELSYKNIRKIVLDIILFYHCVPLTFFLSMLKKKQPAFLTACCFLLISLTRNSCCLQLCWNSEFSEVHSLAMEVFDKSIFIIKDISFLDCFFAL